MNVVENTCDRKCLALVATALPAATGLLELAALGAHVWSGVVDAWGTEVTHRLTSHARSANKHTSGSGWECGSELVEGHDLTTSGEHTSAGGLSEAECADLELWHVEETDVVSDGSDHDTDLVILVCHQLADLGQGNWRAVHLAHEQTLEDNLVEVGLDTTCHEAVELSTQRTSDGARWVEERKHLNEQTNVRVLAVWRGAARVANSASCFHINALKDRRTSVIGKAITDCSSGRKDLANPPYIALQHTLLDLIISMMSRKCAS